MKESTIKFRIIVPAAIVLITLFISFFVGVWHLLSSDLENNGANNLYSCKQFFNTEIAEDKDALSAITDVLARDETLKTLWMQHDREALLQYAAPILSNLRNSYKISHLYFIEPDRTTFLRVHQPDRYGEVIDRFTLHQAVQSQKVTAGLEIGVLGTFSLRLIRPWYIDNRLVGYLEVSKEISNITRKMQEIGDLGVAILIDKKHLDKAGLAEGKGTPWHKLCWDIMPQEAVLYRHPDDLPDQLIRTLNSCDLINNKQATVNYTGEKKYQVGMFPLYDASGANVGRIVIFKDVTGNIATTRSLEYTLGSLFFVLAITFLGLSYWYLGRIEKKLDESNRKALEEAAARERAKNQHLREMLRFEKALNGATDGICITDLGGSLLYYNAAFTQLFGIPPETAQAENEMLSFYCDPQFAKTLFKTVIQGQSYEGLREILSPDGESISILIHGSAIRDYQGSIIGLLIIHTDITKRKHAEDELRRQAVALQESNLALEKASRAAQAAAAAKSDFLANISHEIRTPMTAILGFADTLLDPQLSEQERGKALEIIRRNGQYLMQLINEVLDLSKIEAGKLAIEPALCSTAQILQDITNLMKDRAEEKGLKFITACAGPIPEIINTDSTRLRQILINLVGNAIKFTESGEVRITVSLQQDANHSLLNFDVSDTGIGIPADKLEHVFQAFTQADETVTRKYGGSGLGLTICRRLAAALGGQITVESTPGRGSSFRLSIPTGPLEGVALIDRLDKYTPTTSIARESAPESQKTHLKRISGRILLAEDGPDNQTLISFILRKAGANVTVAENGRIAVNCIWEAKAKSIPFDLVLMDMQMPVLDGYAATSELRKEGFEGPIVALTAHALREDHEKCLAAGCDFYISKPVKREELVDVVAKFLPQSVQC